MNIFIVIWTLRLTFRKKAEDIIDRIIGIYTPAITLSINALFMLTNLFFDSIECWCPHHWTRNWETYSEVVCWISENYFNTSLKIMGQATKSDIANLKLHKSINYIAWVPIVLFSVSLIMKLPKYFWQICSLCTDIDLNNFIADLFQLAKISRSDALNHATGILIYYWEKRNHRKLNLSIFYLVFKLFNTISIIINLIIIQLIFGSPHQILGVQLIGQVFNGLHWKKTYMFPRIVQCIVWRNDDEYPVPHIVPCVLPFNLLYEKIFLLIWIWLAIILILSLLNLVYWIYKLFTAKIKDVMVDNVCELLGLKNKNEKLQEFLQGEAFLIILFISITIDYMFSIEVLEKLMKENSEELSY